MLYFKLISLLLGTALLFFGAFYFIAPQKWVDFFVQKLWPEAGPIVLFPLFLVHLVLSLIGWMICFKAYRTPYAYLVAGFLTLGAVKIGCILPLYKTFRQVMVLLVTTEKFSRRIFAWGGIVLGSGMLYLGAVIH